MGKTSSLGSRHCHARARVAGEGVATPTAATAVEKFRRGSGQGIAAAIGIELLRQ